MYVEIHFLIISRVLEWNYLIRGLESETNSKKKLVPVKNCRSIGKKDMLYNDLTPNIEVNPETYEVKVDGKLATVDPTDKVSMSRLYNLF